MTDVGYSSEYEIYLTKRNGVQIVTNKLSLSILKEMRYREISPSVIAMELGVSKSTIQGNMTKLLRTGIVTQDTRVDDARSAVYHLDAVILFSSDTDIEWQKYARSASVARILKNGRCTSREDLSLYGVSITESGLNIVQGLFNVGAALSRGKDGRAWLDRQIADSKNQAARFNTSLKVDVRNGLNVMLYSSGDNISDVSLIIVPMLGAVIDHADELVGHALAHDASLSVSPDGREILMKVDPYIGQEFEPTPLDVSDPATFRVDEPFQIYAIDGKATLFTNPTMISILDNLYYKDLSINEMEEITGVSKATIYTALMKLIDMGAVALDKDSGTPKKYTLLADAIMYSTEDRSEDAGKLMEIVRRFQAGEIDYHSAVISYSMEILACMGFHFDKMFMRAGRNVAHDVIDMIPDIRPQDFLDIGCNMISIPDQAEIESYIPLKFKLIRSNESLWEAWPEEFLLGFVSEGLKTLLGEKYKINIDVYREGETEPSRHTEYR